MYIGRDMTELTMVSKSEWKEDELAYFHHSLQQILPYLNAEGQSIYKEIVIEIESRGGLQEGDASWTHGTKILRLKSVPNREHFFIYCIVIFSTQLS